MDNDFRPSIQLWNPRSGSGHIAWRNKLRDVCAFLKLRTCDLAGGPPSIAVLQSIYSTYDKDELLKTHDELMQSYQALNTRYTLRARIQPPRKSRRRGLGSQSWSLRANGCKMFVCRKLSPRRTIWTLARLYSSVILLALLAAPFGFVAASMF